jgi:hypothetical protein
MIPRRRELQLREMGLGQLDVDSRSQCQGQPLGSC